MCMFKTHTCLNYFPSGFTNNFTAAITNKMEERFNHVIFKDSEKSKNFDYWFGRGHMYIYGWLMLMYGRNQHDIVKQLSSN